MDKGTDINVERELPAALINWYSFRENTKVLFVSDGFPEFEVLFDVLKGKNINISRIEAGKIGSVMEQFDYVITAGTMEKAGEPAFFLSKLAKLLKEDGALLIGANNRLAVKYFCGDKDYFTGHVLDGIDGYRQVSDQRKNVIGGISYSMAEIKRFLSEAGFVKYRFYSVMPDLMRPQILLAENYIPNELLDVRVFPQYKDPSTIFLEEEKLYPTLFENGMFHQMANGYLIECTKSAEIDDWDQITVQGDRSHEEAMATLIKNGKIVVKKALYPAGENKIETLMSNQRDLEAHRVPMVKAWREGDNFVMPYQKEMIATEYFRDLLRKDKNQFVSKLKEFRDIIIDSSEHVPYEEINWRQFEPGWKYRKEDDPNIDKWEKLAFGTEADKKQIGVILKRGYLDMVSLNCLASDEGFLFFDQEFYIENLPANVIFVRTIDFIYRNCYEMEQIYPREELLGLFDLNEHLEVWRVMGEEFLSNLRNEAHLVEYHRAHRRDYQTIVSNRHRMDYSQEEYNRLFCNIFKNVGSKKIYLFGSGRYAELFIGHFSEYYQISGILDNNEERWGDELEGIPIMTPAVLNEEKEPFKVFICIKFFDDVLVQLKAMNIRDISVYDPRLEYERPIKIQAVVQESKPKPYHIGYVAGVFDLFHIGHLNLLRRAKEQCDYLIVGVVSDEQVIENKKTKPFVAFEERRKIVESCKYVDEAVMIPINKRSTQDAFRMYHFDVQFSGSDYEKDLVWIDARKFLQQHGADLIFFPYTESTSSTKLKEEIRNAAL